MTYAKYPQTSLHITTHKYLVSKLRVKAEKKGMAFGAYMTEFLLQSLENEKRIEQLNQENV